VAQQQLDLLQFPTGSAAQLRRRAAAIMRRDAGTPAASAYGRSICQTTFSERTSPATWSARLPATFTGAGRVRAALDVGASDLARHAAPAVAR
jgi:hypothetical protein